jgi:hypothetical protein
VRSLEEAIAAAQRIEALGPDAGAAEVLEAIELLEFFLLAVDRELPGRQDALSWWIVSRIYAA